MKEICKITECVGCGACLSACGKKAITMQPDTLGFNYPIINQKLCIDCGLCSKVCLNNSIPSFHEPIGSYVGHAGDPIEQLSSTSGGIASVFTRIIILNGGVVYGCSGENAFDVKHIRIEQISDISKLKGSKYVQSYLGMTYKSVLNDLKADRTVLFIGTPCQIAGLKAYLRGKSYDKLYTVDFVCHGVPSQQILNDAIKSNVKEIKGISLVNRVKCSRNESLYTLRLMNGKEKLCDERYPSFGYITGFLCGLFYRENCYECKFARSERVSDITLGDFWNRNNAVKGLKNPKAGLSMIIVNTEHGKKLMDSSKDAVQQVEWSYEDFIRRNGQLERPIQRHPFRNEFETIYQKRGYRCAIKHCLKNDRRRIAINILKNKMKIIILNIPFIGNKLVHNN